MRVLFSEDELDALDGVSLPAERLYRQLRRRMDMRTCTVGRGDSRISRGVLALYCQYIPPRGSKNPAWKPSLYQIDAFIDELARNGLVERAATPQERQKLVLFFPKVVVRPLEEHDMNQTNERATREQGKQHENQGVMCDFVSGEADMLQCNERHISLYLSDEMRGRAQGESCAQPIHSEAMTGLGLVLAKEVGQVDAGLFKAVAAVREVAAERQVTAEEIKSAVYLARQQGAASVAAYAATIIRNGTLVSGVGGAERGKASRLLGRDAVVITPRHRQIADKAGLRLGHELTMFVANARSKATRAVDWSAAFEVWLERSAGFAAARGVIASGGELPWHMTASGIEAKAAEIGFVPPAGAVLFQWKQQLFDLVGLTEEKRQADLAAFG